MVFLFIRCIIRYISFTAVLINLVSCHCTSPALQLSGYRKACGQRTEKIPFKLKFCLL